ncbi:Programmed cell death protein 4 [Rhynchospora pubera]|uniref:Programmed cell death protein 4 n=1 Tax=Rhynchospora pubera TaxID=906938 RepID=A0AAV8CLC5_9POAL|nr:Programmed cell death protein 4 [Rhynchospora pubera]
MSAQHEDEILPPLPRSPSAILSDVQLRIVTGGKPAANGIALRHNPTSNDVSNQINGTLGGATEVENTIHSSPSCDDYRKNMATIISEYFSTGDVLLAASELVDLGVEEQHHYFVKKLVSMSMDRRDKEKEMASVLLSSLYNDTLTPSHIKLGFMNLLESVEDLSVDIPNAVDLLAIFIARAVVDDILPPVFLARARGSLSGNSKGMEALQVAEKSYLSVPHHAEVVAGKWGGSTHTGVEEVKKKISDLLSEFTEGGDVAEACRCVRELGLPFYHHEVVKRALTIAVEKPQTEALVLNFLEKSVQDCLISTSQIAKGFSRISENLDDLTLDVPSAKTTFEHLLQKAITAGWIENLNPNSISSDESSKEEKITLKRYKEECVKIIKEYFLSDDVPELIRSLEELRAPLFNPIFLKRLITIAMDRKDREKEMASALLSSLSMELFSSEDVVKGFVMLLRSVEDTALDILDAPKQLALFLARAVVDEVLVPLNLDEISKKLRPNSVGSETAHMARVLLSARHAGERILRCWGGGTGWQVEDAKDKVAKLLEEYAAGGESREACRCIRDIARPFFNHEVVKKALVMAMEKKIDSLMLDLLEECFDQGLITINQMSKGFSRVREALEDLSLDVPNAAEKYGEYLEYALKHNWVLPAIVDAAT